MRTEVYSTTAGADGSPLPLHLDIFAPAQGTARRAAVLLLHAGGWRYGSRDMVHGQAKALASAGFTALAVQYRLLDTAAWPAAFDDVVSALTWTREHADELGIDADKVIVQGHSAGGHLALLSGSLRPEQRPAAVVAFYPPIGFYRTIKPPTPTADGPPAIELDQLGRLPSAMLLPVDATDAEIVGASPYEHVDAGFPPTLLHHASSDTFVHVRSSQALHARLLDHGVLTELHTYARRDHGFDAAPDFTRITAQLTTSFLERTVLDSQADLEDATRWAFPARG